MAQQNKKSGLSRLMQGMGRLASGLLGTWTAPLWIRWSGRHLSAAGSASAAIVRARPRASAGVLAALLLAGAGGYTAYVWWQARPRPVEVSFTVTNPALTDFANNGAVQPLVVKFSKSVAPLALVGKEVQAGIVATPAIDGRWRWVTDDRLEFAPKQEWPVGAAYTVVLDRSAVAPQARLAQYEFAFASAAFETHIRKAEFYQDPVNPALKKAVFELGFSHPVNSAELETRVELQLAGQAAGVLGVGRQNTPFTVRYDKLKLSAYVHSATLPIPKESTTLNLTVDKGLVAQAGGPATGATMTRAVSVPGLYSLELTEVSTRVVTNERYEPEQVLLLTVSQPVHEREVAKNISVWVLPEFRPGAQKDERALGPYAWSDPAEVTDAVLKLSAKLELTPVAAEREHTELHSFKLRADVGRTLFAQLAPQVKSFGGYLMRGPAQRMVKVPPFPPELRILSQGALLPMSGDKKVAVLVRDLPGLRIEVGRVQPAQLQHLVSQSQGNFTNPEFHGSFGPDNMTERFERKVPLPHLRRGTPHYEAIDLSEYLAKDGESRRGLFLLKVQGYDPKAEAGAPDVRARTEPAEGESGEGRGEAAPQDGTDPSSMVQSRLLLVTDLGLLVKQSTDGSRDVFVQSIASGLPLAGVTVDVVAKNGSTVFSQPTDAGGRAHFDKLEGMTRERAPLLILARKAGDMSFMPLNRNDRQLDYSRFDVGGMASARTQDQLSAYLFSDRGIYRPGEMLRMGLIVKAADWSKPLAGVPLEAEVLDARGLTVKRERLRLAAGGFAELSHQTLETSPTGTYTVNLNIVRDGRVERQIGSTSVKVQEFLPDRMKVTAQLSSAAVDGWVHPKDLKGRINAQNLFGTPAESRRVDASMTLQPAWPAFRSHADYSFYDPQRAKEGFNDELPAGQTDANGDAEFDLRLQRFARATYRLSLLAKVFEPEGGRGVTAETSALVSEQDFLVGVKHDGDLGFVSRGSQRFSHLIAIDPTAKKLPVQGLSLQHVERRVVSVLMRQANDTYRYESRKKESVLSETTLAIPAAGFRLALNTGTAGNFSYVLRDTSGTELNRIDYSVAGEGNVTRSLERNAELQLTLSKKDYEPGEDIEVSIRAPYVGAGLITIERDKVFAQQWFKTTTTASVQKIKLPKDFEGNGYVNVQFVRDPASDEIFMSPLSYGVAPFATSLAQRTNALQLGVPELSKPGQVMKIKLSAEHATRAVVFAVDEGILQVARYQNADPLAFFFQKRALEVRSTQILDLILPEFKRLMAGSAPGGDAAGANARFLNPFKRKGEAPAVYWSGIVDVSGEKEFNYTVPGHFNGTLRVMAVAVNESSVGVAQAKALVRGDFVLSPNLPLMVTPGDQFEVSVGVANNVTDAPKDAPVLLTLKPAATSFELLGAGSQTVKVSAMREGVVRFRLKAKDAAGVKLGSATLEFTASWNGRSTTRRMDVSVRPATPLATTLSLGSFSGSTEVDTPRTLVPEFRKQEVTVSVLPLALAPGLMAYLDNFEHACTEQLVSRSLPALALAKRPEFAQDRPPQNAALGLQQTLNVLRTRQNAQGGFGLWTASVQADEYASVYAVHLMMEARELDVPGAAVPADMLQKGIAYLQYLAASNAADLPAARRRAYAIYLLTRNGAVTTPLLAGLRETLDAKYPAQWKQDATASFLAATYQLLKQEKPAAELIAPMLKQIEQGGPTYRYADYDDPTIRDAQTLYLLARHFPARLKGLDAKALSRFVGPLTRGGYNTVSSAWTILAFDAMARSMGERALGKLGVVQLDAKGVAVPLVLPANLLPRAAFAPGTKKLGLSNDSGLTGYYAVSQSGFDSTPPTQELRSGLEVVREYVGADGKPVQQLKVGDEVTVRLSLRGMPLEGVSGAGAAEVRSVALTDLLPGGFEPVQGRDANGAASTVSGPNLEFADVREDRVVVYGWAGDKVQTYTYRVRATNVGEFTVPPAFAQSMYERERQARSLAGRLVVVAK